MPYRLPTYNVTPNYRPDHCLICRHPLIRSRVGRPRLSCSPTCRQALYRKRYTLYNPDDKRWRADARRAEVELARLERRFGPFDDTPREGGLSPRQRIRFRLSRGIPLLRCKICGKPFIHDAPTGLGVRYCSHRCKEKQMRRYRQLRKAVYVHHDRPLTETALVAIRRGEGYQFCAHCEMPYVPNPASRRKPKYCSQRCRQAACYRRSHPEAIGRANCLECGQRFAVHMPRHKYCSANCKSRAGHSRRNALTEKSHFWGYCIVCGVTIENKKNGGHRRWYCSSRCNSAAHRMRNKQRAEQALGRQARRCKWCGDLLGWQANARRLYCSTACQRHYDVQAARLRRAARPPRPAIHRNCVGCGQSFVVSHRASGRQRFCSADCRRHVYLANRRAIPAPVIFSRLLQGTQSK